MIRNYRIKRNIILFTVLLAFASLLSACGSGSSESSSGNDSDSASGESLAIVTTIFPEYDWVKEILGDQADSVELTWLTDSGVDLHSYEPSVDDMILISTCDVFIYVGGESDAWVDDALENASNSDRIVINLLDVLGDAAKEEETVEGMQAEDEDGETADAESGDDETADTESEDGGATGAESEDDEAADAESGDESQAEEGSDAEDETEYDEHVWLSLKNAEIFCEEIAVVLSEADPANADTYEANTQSYIEELNALNALYEAAAESAAYDTLVFGDRFPFRYLVDDYGISYYAAFAGCSAETEASFETVAFLAGKMDELGLPAILTLEGSSDGIAETIVSSMENSEDVEILSLNSMQSVTAENVSGGMTYLSVMESNLEVLKKALN
ncbi:MAG: zinc ABC transporter substrate-binding protein [Lachnospiraceae bacterium]|nr:zinc ABC transporter substrate-binding protein [Lachnospiraceae bacterium]